MPGERPEGMRDGMREEDSTEADKDMAGGNFGKLKADS